MEHTSPLIIRPYEMDTFAQFPDLPAELRIKIWQFAIPETRAVVIKSPYSRRTSPTSLDKVLPQGLDASETWYSTTTVPALLHVNAEARHEALKHYSLSLGVGKAEPRVYVDFNRDTLFFGDSELTPECSTLWTKTKDFEKIEHLAIVPESAWRAIQWTKDVDLASLQTLIFVHDTEKTKLGRLPQLVVDELSGTRVGLQLGLEQQVQQLEDAITGAQFEVESPVKQRIQAAREELDTLKMVLPVRWGREVMVLTAVFREVGA
ncbi:hypothetical protein F5B22DRAFT_341316 [Xylaria bambusicola]|uniref:uncharacterized protein n=1 Tax=Xylaria bambusicola TaxID=326684 RepID=UPI002008C59C|nr:uncharacterized protein F5B22DRAFT_341316 [Xylaria bambusicola]KAI0525437.1 hypothetical protein F5B22DRAFT_341316 [Xylaria bambusicola]